MTPNERYECARVARDAIAHLCFPTDYQGETIPPELYRLFEELRNVERYYATILRRIDEAA